MVSKNQSFHALAFIIAVILRSTTADQRIRGDTQGDFDGFQVEISSSSLPRMLVSYNQCSN